MSELNSYLKKHFLNFDQFAALNGVATSKLSTLISSGVFPEPSYVVSSGMIKSYVFGEMAAPDGNDGAYFHPKICSWLDLALVSKNQNELKLRFNKNYALALAELDQTMWRLTDSFTGSGEPITSALNIRLENAWEHLLRGTFGLCVADPSSERTIARKEILQEKLSTLTNNGLNPHPTNISRDALLKLIHEYADSTMPFSPIEYPRSSRKRLVTDLLTKLED